MKASKSRFVNFLNEIVKIRDNFVRELVKETVDELIKECGRGVISLLPREKRLKIVKEAPATFTLISRGFLKTFVIKFVKECEFDDINELADLIVMILGEDEEKVASLCHCLLQYLKDEERR